MRRPYDAYSTPAWCVHRLLEAVDLPSGRWLEPAVGEGAIVRAVNQARPDIQWTTCDIRPEVGAQHTLDFVAFGALASIADEAPWDVVITNPPYSQAALFVAQAWQVGRIVVMLLRLGWLSSARRAAMLRSRMPSVYVLPDRPSFTGNGSAPGDLAWMVWGLDEVPTIRLLATTPYEERRRCLVSI